MTSRTPCPCIHADLHSISTFLFLLSSVRAFSGSWGAHSSLPMATKLISYKLKRSSECGGRAFKCLYPHILPWALLQLNLFQKLTQAKLWPLCQVASNPRGAQCEGRRWMCLTFGKKCEAGPASLLSVALTLSQSSIIADWLLPVSVLWLNVKRLLMSFSLAGLHRRAWRQQDEGLMVTCATTWNTLFY